MDAPDSNLAGPRVLLASNYNDGMALYNGLCFEFLRIIESTTAADIIAPRRFHPRVGFDVLRTSVSNARRLFGHTRVTRLKSERVRKKYDLFFYVCMNPSGLADLQAIQGWREQCDQAAVFIFETWSSQLPRDKAHLKLLDQFDHVFVYNRSSIPNLGKYTSTQRSFLAAGADCLSASPYPNPPNRCIDVYSMGRRLDFAHRQLLEMARNGEIFYIYDAGGGLHVYDFGEARFLTLNYIKRSRYFTAYSLDAGSKAQESFGEQAIATRLFEGAAGGSIILGTPPKAQEFKELFDWPDAVVEIPAEPTDMRAIYRELEAQPERMQRARFMNATQSLRKHDWVYRWEQILHIVGFESPPGVSARKRALQSLAEGAEIAGMSRSA
jgi:Glycosyl transferases group 1